jgi:hypothetical protein
VSRGLFVIPIQRLFNVHNVIRTTEVVSTLKQFDPVSCLPAFGCGMQDVDVYVDCFAVIRWFSWVFTRIVLQIPD